MDDDDKGLIGLVSFIIIVVSAAISLINKIDTGSIFPNLSKSDIRILSPENRVRYLSALERKSEKYFYGLKNAVTKEARIVNDIGVDLVNVKKYIEKGDYRKALNLTISIKGDISNIKSLDTSELTARVDSLRQELYHKVRDK